MSHYTINFFKVALLLVVWWLGSIAHTYLDWQWQAQYDRHLHQLYPMEGVQ